ncbi:hypothetical protein MBRA_06335 [Methylobacterium brachiatum]|nr:hypothetical protein MBRA_06335 [Methylobacterium brachiatum]
MAQETEAPKRRGRPRLNDEARKRHTMTFRMRDDLRAAVEELAQANGRSLSEQIEYYVEASVRSEAALIYQYSTEAMSPVLFKAITGRERGADGPGLDVSFPSEHREMLTIAGQTCLNQPGKLASSVAWPADVGELRQLMCDAAREGAHQALRSYVFVDASEFDGKPLEKATEHHPGPPSDSPPQDVPPGARRTLSRAAMERQRVKYGDLAGLPPGRDATDDYFVQLRRDHIHDFTTAALRRVIGRLGEDVLQLVPKFAPGWPQQFADLPSDTRSALIGHLQHDATSVYQTLMSPKSPRGEALTAFRRIRNALLPRELADEDAGEGPDEDLSDVPDTGHGRGKRNAQARR